MQAHRHISELLVARGWLILRLTVAAGAVAGTTWTSVTDRLSADGNLASWDNPGLLILMIGCGSFVGFEVAQLALSRLWNQITPIRDRVTYVEDEGVILCAAFFGPLVVMAFLLRMPLPVAATLAGAATVTLLPVLTLVGLAIRRVHPISPEASRARSAEIAELRAVDPFMRNIFAYTVAGAACIAAQLASFVLVLAAMASSTGTEISAGVVWSVMAVLSVGMITVAVLAPFAVAVSRAVFGPVRSVGLHYLFGHVLLMLIVVPVLWLLASDLPMAELVSLPYIGAGLVMTVGWAAGGWTLQRLYRTLDVRPLAFT